MSKAVLDQVVSALNGAVAINAEVKALGFDSIGQLHRDATERAVHELDVDPVTIELEIGNILRFADIKVKENTLVELANRYQKTLVSKLRAVPGVTMQGYTAIVNTKANNYNVIYRSLRDALATPDSPETGYAAFKSFLINTIKELEQEEYGDNNPEGNKNSEYLAENVNKVKGLDVGHEELSSNVINAVGVVLFNKLRTIKQDTLTPEVTADLKRIEDELLALANKREFLAAISREYGISSPELFSQLIKTTVGYARRYSEGSVHGVLDVEYELLTDNIHAVAETMVNRVFPQSGDYNQMRGASIEKSIADKLINTVKDQAGHSFRDFLQKYLSGQQLPLVNYKARKLLPLIELEGSPSIKRIIGDSIYNLLKTGKTPNISVSGRTTHAIKKVSAKPSNTSKDKKIPNPTKLTPVVVKKRRKNLNTQGETNQTNIINVVNLINMKLAETIRQNMGSPRLNYRTGRFAKSATVLPGMMDKDGALRLPYTYMKYPYQTFEPGFARGSTARDPKAVIGESIKELAIRLVLMKMRVVRV